MSISFTLKSFPKSVREKDNCGLPWGALIRPLGPFDKPPPSEEKFAHVSRPASLLSSDIARCSSCGGFISPQCYFTRKRWICGLCREPNPITERYADENRRAVLPELCHSSIEYTTADSFGASDSTAATLQMSPDVSNPAYILLVDVSGSSDYIDLIKTSLLAALEALPGSSWLGICLFSNRIGLFDLTSDVPHIMYAHIPAHGKRPTGLMLNEIMSLDSFLVPICTHKDNISVAIESISSHFGDSNAESKIDGNYPNGTLSPELMSELSEKEQPIQRGFGSAIAAISDYVSSDDDSNVSARILTFLSGIPNYGMGSLDPSRFLDPDQVDHDTLLHSQTDFYANQAELAASAGICFDLYILSNLQYIDLASLRYLTLVTGGNLLYYDSIEDVSLPQDVYRQMAARPLGFQCLLRVRTSPEFNVASFYGHLMPDREHDGLFLMAGCDPHKVVSVTFEFASGMGFSSFSESHNYVRPIPLLQMAFSYTAEKEALDANGDPYMVAVRKRRVVTCQLEVAKNYADLYRSSNADTVVTQLVHQVIQASVEGGLKEARLLAQDWLIYLQAMYRKYTARRVKNSDFGPKLSESETLQFIPRFIFAMLKSPILNLNYGEVHPDIRVYLQCLYSALESRYLSKALYPELSTFSSNDKRSRPALFLSQVEVNACDDPLFMLYTFEEIYVYFKTKSKQDLQFPPPHESYLREHVSFLQASSPLISPRIFFVSDSSPEVVKFMSHLIEDVKRDFNWDKFESYINKEVKLYLKNES